MEDPPVEVNAGINNDNDTATDLKADQDKPEENEQEEVEEDFETHEEEADEDYVDLVANEHKSSNPFCLFTTGRFPIRQ
jgi:hypothetical protein